MENRNTEKKPAVSDKEIIDFYLVAIGEITKKMKAEKNPTNNIKKVSHEIGPLTMNAELRIGSNSMVRYVEVYKKDIPWPIFGVNSVTTILNPVDGWNDQLQKCLLNPHSNMPAIPLRGPIDETSGLWDYNYVWKRGTLQNGYAVEHLFHNDMVVCNTAVHCFMLNNFLPNGAVPQG